MAIADYKEFWGLLIFGNIENLVIACQGATEGLDPVVLGVLSIAAVIMWFVLGTYGTQVALKYSRVIEFLGGFIIFALGIQAILGLFGII